MENPSQKIGLKFFEICVKPRHKTSEPILMSSILIISKIIKSKNPKKLSTNQNTQQQHFQFSHTVTEY
jgi:hypothetical protein